MGNKNKRFYPLQPIYLCSMRHPLTILLVLFFLQVHGQNLPVGKRTISFVDGSRSNRSISTEFYYPGVSAGTNVALAAGTEKYPVIVFGHGFVMTPAAYVWLADSLVKHGFIVAFPSTESGLSPSHEQFGRDLAFLTQRITSLNDSSGNFLFGRVANKSALGGHSMGGGCSLLAMTYNTQVQAVFNFAAAETNPSAKAAATTIQKPALIFSGSQDCIVAPSEQQTMYSNIPYPCKSYINITGGLHCHFGNNDATCSFGQLSSGCNSSSISAPTLFSKTISVLRPFLQHYLKADCTAAALFESTINNLSGVTTLRSCSSDPLGCVVTSLPGGIPNPALSIFPNPSSIQNGITLKLKQGVFNNVKIFDLSGRTIRSYNRTGTNQIRISAPIAGSYLICAETTVGIFYRQIIFHK